jgi:hypothetical protein
VTIKIEKDGQFLIMQRLDVLSCSMAGVDNILSKKEARKTASEEQFNKLQPKYKQKIPVVQHSTLQCLCLEQVACPRTRIQLKLRVIQTRTVLLHQYVRQRCHFCDWCSCQSSQA